MQTLLSLKSSPYNSAPQQTVNSLAAKTRIANKFAINPEASSRVSEKTAQKNALALKAAKEFEASFLTTMLEQMWTGVEADAPFGGGHAEKVYRSMMVGEYAKSISANGGLGIADHVYREILSAQEGHR